MQEINLLFVQGGRRVSLINRFRKTRFQVAQKLSIRGLSLPSGVTLREENIEYIAKTVYSLKEEM